MPPRDPDPAQPFPSGAKAAPHTSDSSNREDSRRHDEEHARDTNGDQRLPDHSQSLSSAVEFPAG